MRIGRPTEDSCVVLSTHVDIVNGKGHRLNTIQTERSEEKRFAPLWEKEGSSGLVEVVVQHDLTYLHSMRPAQARSFEQ